MPPFILPLHPHEPTVSPKAPPSQRQGLRGQQAGSFTVQMGKSSQGAAVKAWGRKRQGPALSAPGLALGSASRTSRSSAAVRHSARSDALAQAGSEPGVETPSSAPSCPISHPTPATWNFLQFLKLARLYPVSAHAVPSAWKVISPFSFLANLCPSLSSPTNSRHSFLCGSCGRETEMLPLLLLP